mmetsp:Transcript_78262/g.135790  ORF Transcript_78262/g.135790 Transcript_78262/m.135790 type:complete len:230 (+) Transcript_78262:505-1194(+)
MSVPADHSCITCAINVSCIVTTSCADSALTWPRGCSRGNAISASSAAPPSSNHIPSFGSWRHCPALSGTLQKNSKMPTTAIAVANRHIDARCPRGMHLPACCSPHVISVSSACSVVDATLGSLVCFGEPSGSVAVTALAPAAASFKPLDVARRGDISTLRVGEWPEDSKEVGEAIEPAMLWRSTLRCLAARCSRNRCFVRAWRCSWRCSFSSSAAASSCGIREATSNIK